MNTKSLKTYLATTCLLLLAGSMAGCFDQITDGKYHGPPLVQFYPHSNAVLDGSGVVDIRVQLVAEGGALGQEKQFSVSVVGDQTTADSYELLTQTFTIEADTVRGEVRVDVNAGAIPPGEVEQLTLQLQPSQDGEVQVAENFKFFALTIIGRSAKVTTTPAEVTFSGNVALEASARVDTVLIVNAGGATEATTISNISIAPSTDTTATGENQFTLLDPPSAPITLAPGDTARFRVQFAPDKDGDFAAQLDYDATNVTANAAKDFGVPITGGGTNDDGTFVAELEPLNRFYDVSGKATFVVGTSGLVDATVEVQGLPGSDTTLHVQHIHLAPSCPTIASADANGDNFIDVLEGVPDYGPILLPLDSNLSSTSDTTDTFPTGESYLYTAAAPYAEVMASISGKDPNPKNAVVKIETFEALDLDGRTVVIHGVPLSYELPSTVATIGGLPPQVTLPIACGTIERQ